MSRFLLIVSVLMFSIAGSAFAQTIFGGNIGVDSESEPQGVFCEINSVRLFAKTSSDCEKAGGSVTHVITRTVTPAGDATDNPGQEPEIQREKDKEPVAP